MLKVSTLFDGHTGQRLEGDGRGLGQIPQKRAVDDIKRFESALDAIIAADGAYVSDKDLRNGHRMVMQRLVRGGAIRNGDNNGTKMTVEEGLDKIMASWKGLTKKLEARA